MTQRLSTEVFASVGSATLVGRIWRVAPLPLWSGDTTGAANTYRSRNAGKTRDVRTWLGVRYAQPPVGPLRWRNAVDYDYPGGTIQCDKFGNIPHQVYDIEGSTIGRPEWGVDLGAANKAIRDNSEESEDCLFLNIYCPPGPPPSGGFPVVFWVHGGGNVVRSATEPQERGHRLATEDLIVVTPEYRLGNFGYFYHPNFESEPGWYGPNYAYSDLKSALRWVNRNIVSFGGDPSRVLIGGSSAGGVHMLNLMEDASVQSLFSASWISSGGGTGERPHKAPTPKNLGYAERYDLFCKAAKAVAASSRDYSRPERTLQQALAEAGPAGEGMVLRLGLSPSQIQAFSDERERLTFPNWNMGTASFTIKGSENIYPFIGNGLNYARSIDAADAGVFKKPFVNVTAENEATMQPSYASWGEGTAGAWLRLIRVPNFQEWIAQPWMPSGWSADEQRRQVYNHSIWHYAARRVVSSTVKHGGTNRAYLVLWGFGSGPAPHSGDVVYLFGNLEWGAGMDGSEARVTERMVKMSAGMQRLIRNLAYNGNPNVNAPPAANGFNLFATVPSFVLAAWTPALSNHWNVAGSTNTLGGGSAPVQIAHQAYLPGAWDYYDQNFPGA